jgi:hypothetical protein
MRFIAVVSASLVVAACSSKPTQGGGGSGSAGSATAGSAAVGSAGGSAGGSGSAAAQAGSGNLAAVPAAKPASTLAQVQAGASGAKVVPAEIAVTGVDLFQVSDAKPLPDDEGLPPKLVGVVGGAGGEVVEGRPLLRAVIAAKPAPKALAQIALWAAGDDGELLLAAKTREQRKAKVGPPAIARNALGFWVLTTDMPRMLEHGTLELSNGMLDLALAPLPPKQAISNAMTTLGSVAVSRHATAIRTLAASCSDARARQALLAALSNHPRMKTRAAIADEAHRCGPAAVDALVTAMEQDGSRVVRAQAAAALGRIGDPRARPALAKAVRGDDANLAYTAGNALKKLK